MYTRAAPNITNTTNINNTTTINNITNIDNSVNVWDNRVWVNNDIKVFNAMIKIKNEGVGPTNQMNSIGCSIKWK